MATKHLSEQAMHQISGMTQWHEVGMWGHIAGLGMSCGGSDQPGHVRQTVRSHRSRSGA